MTATTIRRQLITAVEANNLSNVREILSQKNGNGRWTATNNDIHRAFKVAADKVRLECCRLLFFRLSQRGKQKYLADVWEGLCTTSGWEFPLLTQAVMNGHLQLVRLFVEEFKFNVNQADPARQSKTPLFYAGKKWEICRLLLENGADFNIAVGSRYKYNGALEHFIHEDSTNAVRLLLEHGADPNLNRRPATEEDGREGPRASDYAISKGNTEILRMLLQHGAFLGTCNPTSETSLIYLLRLDRHRDDNLYRVLERHGARIHRERLPEVKLSICRMLVEHAETDKATADFLQRSLEIAITNAEGSGPGSYESSYKILLEAGMDSSSALYLAIRAGKSSVCRTLVTEYRADPFLERDEEGDDGEYAATPFQAAARMENTDILEYFLELWDDQFSFYGGKNSDGDYPIHILCCDPLVSREAIKLLAERQVDTLAMAGGQEGLLPLHIAAMWDASLDVIFCLLQHGPDALGQPQGARRLSNTGEVTTMTNHHSRPSSGNMEGGPATKRAKTSN